MLALRTSSQRIPLNFDSFCLLITGTRKQAKSRLRIVPPPALPGSGSKGRWQAKPSSQPGLSQLPVDEETKIRVFKRWLFGFFEEIAWPVGPAGLLRFRTEINLQLHANFQGFESRCSDNAGQLDAFFHFYNSHRIGSHMFELRL